MPERPAALSDWLGGVGGVHQVIQVGRARGGHRRERNGGVAVMQRGGGQDATDRDLAIGHVDMELVADPGFLVPRAVLLRSARAGRREVVQHRLFSHGALPLQPRELLRPLCSLFRSSSLPLRGLGRFPLGGRLLAGLDGGRVSGEVTKQPVCARFPDQRVVDVLRELRGGERGEGA